MSKTITGKQTSFSCFSAHLSSHLQPLSLPRLQTLTLHLYSLLPSSLCYSVSFPFLLSLPLCALPLCLSAPTLIGALSAGVQISLSFSAFVLPTGLAVTSPYISFKCVCVCVCVVSFDSIHKEHKQAELKEEVKG